MYSIKLEPALNNIVLARAKGEKTSYAIFAGDEKNEAKADSGLMKENKTNVQNISDDQVLAAVTQAEHYDFGKKTLDKDAAVFNKAKDAIKDALKDPEFNTANVSFDAIEFTNNQDVFDLKGQLDAVEAQLKTAKGVADKAGATPEIKKAYKAAEEKFNNLKALVAQFRKDVVSKAANDYGKDSSDHKNDKIVGNIFTEYDKESVVDFAKIVDANTDAKDYGLVLKNGNDKLVGRDEIRLGKTRIFGHNYGHDFGDAAKNNSWSRAVLYAAKPNSDFGLADVKLGVVPMRLNHVQYGRVSANLDIDINNIDDGKVSEMPGNAGWKLVAAELAERVAGDNGDVVHSNSVVDTYFYRGVGATSLAQMDALKNTTIKYAGHAVAFGVDRTLRKETEAGNLPNSFAFGSENAQMVGDFVEATVDLGKNQVTGSIYDVWRVVENDKDGDPAKVTLTQNALIKFKGGVVGNTVAGVSELAYDENSKGSFRASFYGPKADEMGGVVNSTTTGDKFKETKWGAVFGAQRIVDDAIKTPDFQVNIPLDPMNDEIFKK